VVPGRHYAVAPVRNAGIDTFDDVRSDPGLSDFGWPGLFVSGTSSEGATSMLDEIFELFERDKKKRNGHPAGKRSLLDRVSGMLGDDRGHEDDRDRNDERRRYDDDRRQSDDGRPRSAEVRSRDDDDDHDRDSEYGKPSKKRRLADLLEFD